jgi:maltodextrin utilization protein YvdJ
MPLPILIYLIGLPIIYITLILLQRKYRIFESAYASEASDIIFHTLIWPVLPIVALGCIILELTDRLTR